MRAGQQVADVEDVGIGIGREVSDLEIGDSVGSGIAKEALNNSVCLKAWRDFSVKVQK